ncbi:MAG: hypothetical protein ACOCXJ_09170, partial [Planctomycetota bacterium]
MDIRSKLLVSTAAGFCVLAVVILTVVVWQMRVSAAHQIDLIREREMAAVRELLQEEVATAIALIDGNMQDATDLDYLTQRYDWLQHAVDSTVGVVDSYRAQVAE